MRCPECNRECEEIGQVYMCVYCEKQITNMEATAEFSRYGNTKEREPQIYKDFSKYPVPEKIRNKAADIYVHLMGKGTLKGDRRIAMMVLCTSEAYKSEGILKDPVLLANSFGITVIKLRSACLDFHRKVFEKQLIDTYPKRHLTAKELLPEFLEVLEIEDAPLEDLLAIIDALYSKGAITTRYAPRDIAITVAYLCNTYYDGALSLDETRSRTLIPNATITRILDLIKKI